MRVTRAARFAESLDAVGPDRDLVDDADGLSLDSPILLLENELRGVPGVGRTIATKLMARKRPRLAPIYDVVVGRVLNTVTVHRDPIREALSADGGALHTKLLTIRAAAALPDEISASSMSSFGHYRAPSAVNDFAGLRDFEQSEGRRVLQFNGQGRGRAMGDAFMVEEVLSLSVWFVVVASPGDRI